LIGFDQGKLPAKDVEVESEIYQMLVALTRAKKRIYLVNTVGRQISKFIDYIDSECYEEI
jgi:superfamily I DNA/RNA helicase